MTPSLEPLPSWRGSMVWIMSWSSPCRNLVPGGPEDEDPARPPDSPEEPAEPPAPLPPPTLVVLDVVGLACCNTERPVRVRVFGTSILQTH